MATEAKIRKVESIPRAILDEELLQHPQSIDVYVALIKNAKDTSQIVKELNKNVPIPTLQHLKRVSANRVLLCPKSDLQSGDMRDFLSEKGFKSVELLGDVTSVEVASTPPKIRSQYGKARQSWPCNFHPDSYLEKLTSNTLFTHEELEMHRFYMKMCLETSEQFTTSVTLIIDPKTQTLVAFGRDKTNESPIRHPIMVAIDNVAKTQGGGMWQDEEVDQRILHFLEAKELVLRKKRIQDDYLCTNFVLYTIYEPCIMCAMSLVHSRIKRVFYSERRPNGALGSLCKLHLTKGLNHHFEAFEGLLLEQCRNSKIARLPVN